LIKNSFWRLALSFMHISEPGVMHGAGSCMGRAHTKVLTISTQF